MSDPREARKIEAIESANDYGGELHGVFMIGWHRGWKDGAQDCNTDWIESATEMQREMAAGAVFVNPMLALSARVALKGLKEGK